MISLTAGEEFVLNEHIKYLYSQLMQSYAQILFRIDDINTLKQLLKYKIVFSV